MKKLWKWFLDGWNEIDPLQEAVLADYDNWIKQKPKNMTKYRIVETYRYKENVAPADYTKPGYVLQYLRKRTSPDMVFESWEDLHPISYVTQEEAKDSLNMRIQRDKVRQVPDKVVYETEA